MHESGAWDWQVDELPSQAVEREVFEETGYEVRAERLFYLHDPAICEVNVAGPFHVYTIFFLCTLLPGPPATRLETTEGGFFAEDNLPPLSAPRNTRKELARAFAAGRDPDGLASFD